MIKLQNDFTTPEQSGMLIEMGVPDGLSADCYYELGKIKVRTDEQLYEDFFHDNGLYIPCWSVGRLMEIYAICRCYDRDWDEVYGKETYIETYISAIKEAVLDDMLDFSRLED